MNNNIESNNPEMFNPQQNKQTRKYSKVAIWLPLVIAISIAVGIFVGNAFTKYDSGGSLKPLFKRNYTKLDALFDYMNKAYVDTVNIHDIVEEAIPTIISTLDPHSAYISAEDMRSVGSELEGYFGGIGVEFIVNEDTVCIVNVTLGGPSEAMGIMAGDKIVTVNDSVFAGIGLSNAKIVKTLRGDIGSKVKIGIKRATSDEILNFDLTRASVPVESVDAAYMIDENIGYIKIQKFAMTTYNEFISAIAKLKKQGATAFIIDLQGNTGGSLMAVNMMVNEFLESGEIIVYTEGRSSPREDYVANGTGTCKRDEVVVLIDEGSASASEIFAGAIQDHDRGLIVGRRSFGKGLVQNQHQFSDGSAIRLTVSRYHTPSGRCIQKPYERGNRGDYDYDIVNRYNRGEFFSRDSIKVDNLPVFYTKNGRPVYGDDGVLADVFVPRDTTGINSYALKIFNSGILREFAFKYSQDNKQKLKDMGDWKTAYKYLSAQPLVEYLVSYAETKKVRRRPVLIQEAHSLMKSQLEGIILRNIFKEGYYEITQKDDITINKAVELIKQGKASPDAVAEELYAIKNDSVRE